MGCGWLHVGLGDQKSRVRSPPSRPCYRAFVAVILLIHPRPVCPRRNWQHVGFATSEFEDHLFGEDHPAGWDADTGWVCLDCGYVFVDGYDKALTWLATSS